MQSSSRKRKNKRGKKVSEEKAVASQQVSAMNVAAEGNTGKEYDDKDNVCSEQRSDLAEGNAEESKQLATEAISSEEPVTTLEVMTESENVRVNDEMAFIPSEHKEILGTEEAFSENIYHEPDLPANVIEDVDDTVVEHQKYEETFSRTIFAADESRMNEMCKEVESLRISESQLQRDLLETQAILSLTRNDLESKDTVIGEMRERLAEKESMEALARSSLQQETDKTQLQEAAMVELTEKLEQMKDRCNNVELDHEQKIQELALVMSKLEEQNVEAFELRTKLEALETEKEQMSFEAQNFKSQMADLETTLNQSSDEKSQLEATLKNFGERCAELESRANATLERNLELEAFVRDLESSLEMEKNRTNALQQEIAAKTKEYSDSEKSLETQMEQMSCRVQELILQISELESALSQSLSLKGELESQVMELNDRCNVDESRASVIKDRNIELEELVRELELQLESEKGRTKYLEQEMETRSKDHSDMVLELSTRLEDVVQLGAEKEKGWQIDQEQMNCRVQELTLKISELESALRQSLALRCELESRVDELNDKCALDESRATVISARNLELEELVRELEVQLDSGKSRINYLEQEIETKSEEYTDTVFALSTQLENAELLRAEKEKDWETDKEQMNCRVQELTIKMVELESALGQSLGLRGELESQVKELSHKCALDESRANIIRDRNLELEGLVRELEFQLQSGKSRINYLEQEVNNLEQKSAEYFDMVSTLSTQLQYANTSMEEMRNKLQESECRSEEADLKNQELMEQLSFLKSNYDTQLEEINIEHESRADMAQKHIRELEDLVRDQEQLLENQQDRIKNLEQDVEILELKYGNAEAKSNENADVVSALRIDVDNEKQLVLSLNMAIEDERRRSEEDIRDSKAKLQEAENLLQVLRTELLATQDKLEMAGIKEIEVTRMLQSAQAQLQEQGRVLEESMAKTKELESLNFTLINDTEVKLQELVESLKNKENEVNSLNEELHVRENQIKHYVEEADVMADALTKELNNTKSLVENNTKLTNMLGELQQTVDSANAEKEEVVSTIIEQNETKVRVLQETISHKESEAKELSNKCSILEEQLKIHESRKVDQAEVILGLEAKLAQLEMQIGALIEVNKNLDGELARSQAKLNDLQESFNTSMNVVEDLKQELSFERQSFQSRIDSITEENQHLFEASRVAQIEMQTIETELEKQLEEYKESNGALEAELENLKLQATQNSALQSRVKELDEQLRVHESQFQKEIATILEEKRLLLEENRVAYNEVQTISNELKRQFKEYKESNGTLKAELENLNLQVTQNFALQNRVNELEEQIRANESRFNKEIATIMEEKQLLRETSRNAETEVLKLTSDLEALTIDLERVTLKGSQDSCMETRVTEVAQLHEVENVFESASRLDGDIPGEMLQQFKEEIIVSPPTYACIEQEPKNGGGEKKRKVGKPSTTNSKSQSPVKNIQIALGIALVSVVTAVLARKK